MGNTDDDIAQMPMWKSYLYHLQQQAPKPKRISSQKDIQNRPPYYGKEYHGAISRDEADFLLTIGGEGSYLIRESQRAPGQFTLAIRFEGVTKNFKLYFDNQHYVGEKKFDAINDLVADGLITFYLESKAADYIAALSKQTNYAESPYMAFNTHKKQQQKQLLKQQQHKQQQQQQHKQHHQQQPMGAPARPPRSHLATPPQANKPQPIPEEPSRWAGEALTPASGSKEAGRAHRAAPQPPPVSRHKGAHPASNEVLAGGGDFLTPPSSPSSTAVIGSQNQDRQPMGEAKNNNNNSNNNKLLSSVVWCADFMQVMGCEKAHNFKLHTFKGPHWCDFCANFLWGLIAQGVKCQDCGLNAHKKCSERVPNDCMPDMKYVKRVFGVDLTTLVKAQNTLLPVIVEKCIKEIEKRGLESEGLYRVAGFHDDVEAIRMSFDKDGEQTDISEEKYEDLNTVASLLKLYFRLLPIPLITFDVYFKVIDAVKREDLSGSQKLEQIKNSLDCLPPAHYHTLKYLVNHLYKVTQKQQQNMMNAENLAIVFAPTLLRSPETDPLFSLTAVRYEREFIELLILNHHFLFE